MPWVRKMAVLGVLTPPAAMAPLPDAGEFARTVECLRGGRHLDVTKTTQPEELPPCVDACPLGSEVKWQQCVRPAPHEGLEEVRLLFQLRERCLETECGGLQHWKLHLEVMGMKVAQYLGVPTQELKGALIFYPAANTSWDAFDGSNETGTPPVLEKFIFARLDEPGIGDSRRLEGAQRQYLVHSAFRADSARISLFSRPVREIAERVHSAVSAFLGTDVEVLQPQANKTRRSFAAVSHSDFRALYKFEGFDPNKNPYVADKSADNLPGSALGFECVSPCWEANEQRNTLGGAHRCGGDCDCAGRRRCSPIGYCTGDAGVCADANTTAEVPGYECRASAGHGTASGSRSVALTPEGCGLQCNAIPVCGAFEWHGPDFCFLIADPTFALPPSGSAGVWSACKRLVATTSTTLAGAWMRPLQGDPLAEISSGCRAALVRTTARQGLEERLRGCTANETAAEPGCLRVSCIGVHTITADLACQEDLCAADGEIDAIRFWRAGCDDSALVALLQTSRSRTCTELFRDPGVPDGSSGPDAGAGDAAGGSAPKEPDGGGAAGIAAGVVAVPVAGCLCVAARLAFLRFRNRPVVMPQTRKTAMPRWKPPDWSGAGWPSVAKATVREPPPQMSSPASTPKKTYWSSWLGESSSAANPEEGEGGDSVRSARTSGSWASSEGEGSPASGPMESSPNGSGNTRRNFRQVPRPRVLPSSPPIFRAHGPEGPWAQFGAASDGSPCSRKGSASPAAEPQASSARSSPASPLRKAATACESPGATQGSWQPGTPGDAWAEAQGGEHGRAGAAGSTAKDPPREAASTGSPSPRASSSGRRASGSTDGRKGPAAWTQAGNAKPQAKTAPSSKGAQGEAGGVEHLSPHALAAELERLRQSAPLQERRRFFLAQCLKWHPDKNAGNEARATQMFHVLQEKKDWFLANNS